MRRFRWRWCGQQVEALKHEAQSLAAQSCQIRLFQPRHIDAVEEIAAARRPIEAARIDISVDLPEPDEP